MNELAAHYLPARDPCGAFRCRRRWPDILWWESASTYFKDLFPGPVPVGVLWDRASLLSLQSAKSTGPARDWQLPSLEVRDAGEIEGALETAATAGAGVSSQWERSPSSTLGNK